ncbi:MAG: FtsW/RodA/SpoVE family cell cycle protein [Clostridia bacterium]|nr:FtsW/RodA/SpoVE family cell cycle protein [Clostridia bacterium]
MKILQYFRNFLRETDFMLLIPCLLLSAFGVLMVHSATLYKISSGTVMHRDTQVMLIAVLVGIFLALLISIVDYEFIIRLWPVVAVVGLVLMLALFKWGVSPDGRDDAFTWIKIPKLGIMVQPSEILKIAFIITFSMHLDMLRDKINEWKSILLLFVHAVIPIGLVVRTGDVGSALVFVFIFVGLLFLSGVYLRYFAAAIAFGAAAAPILWMIFFSDFQKDRFLAVYNPNALEPSTYETIIYQQKQGINAISNGGFKGAGLFKGLYTQNGLVPESRNDMVFTVVCEELGFWGAILLLGLLAFVVVHIIFVAKNTRDNVSKLLCWGSALMIGSQVFINIGMCLKVLPVIGITLPFMSAGGSSNLCVYLAVGLVLSVYRFNKDRAPVNFRLLHVSTPFSDY